MLAPYISELLYKHECVILPDFGGFVANYKSADIHPVQHRFSPPSRAISFNKYLLYNDGLLVNAIAEAKHISYDEALKLVEQTISEYKAKLGNDGMLVLPAIGKLYFDVEQKLQFAPDSSQNYSLAAFGLPEVQSYPVLRKQAAVEVQKEEQAAVQKKVLAVQKPKPHELITIAEPEETKSEGEKEQLQISRKRWLAAAMLLLFAGALSLMLTNTNIDSIALNESGLHKLFGGANKEVPKEILKPANGDIKLSIDIPSLNKGAEVVEIEASPATATTTPAVPDAVEPASVPKEDIIEADIISANKKKEGYYIILGAFSKSSNTQKMKAELESQGKTVAVIGGGGLERVGYFASSNETDALKLLTQAQQNQPDAWLLFGNY